MILPPHRSTLFPYTTLFRSRRSGTSARASFSRFFTRGSSRRESAGDRKSTRLNSSHRTTSYAVFCLKKKTRRRLLTRTSLNHCSHFERLFPQVHILLSQTRL